MVQEQPLDIVGIAIALLTYMVSKDVALVLGPYAAIVLLAFAGAAFCLSGLNERIGIVPGVWFITIRVLVAVAITVSLAEVIQRWLPSMQPRYTLAPIAFGIGFIRDVNQVRAGIGDLLGYFFRKRIDDGK